MLVHAGAASTWLTEGDMSRYEQSRVTQVPGLQGRTGRRKLSFLSLSASLSCLQQTQHSRVKPVGVEPGGSQGGAHSTTAKFGAWGPWATAGLGALAGDRPKRARARPPTAPSKSIRVESFTNPRYAGLALRHPWIPPSPSSTLQRRDNCGASAGRQPTQRLSKLQSTAQATGPCRPPVPVPGCAVAAGLGSCLCGRCQCSPSEPPCGPRAVL